jgi:hypothetical protein
MAKKLKLGKHAGNDKTSEPAFVKKSKRNRRNLIIVLVVLVLLLAAGCAAGYFLIGTSESQSVQQENKSQSVDEHFSGETKDTSDSTTKLTVVPDLVQLIGISYDEAFSKIGHGAQVSADSELNEEGNPVKREVRLALTEEMADSKSGTPTVTLSMGEDSLVIKASYGVATSSLGYGSISFSDAIQNEHIVEKTLSEAGLDVSSDQVVLPDKSAYSAYASDGKTLTKETYTFEGVGVALGANYSFGATLTYDYSMANATGNLADTIRSITISVSKA